MGWTNKMALKHINILKDQINVIRNNIKDNFKIEDDAKSYDEIIMNVDQKYICDEFKNFIANNFWIMD